jgi:hypothetical protein
VQEVFFTVLAIWVIWKLYAAFSNSNSRKTTQQFHQTNHHHYHQKKEGDVIVEQTQPKKKNKPVDDGDYVDYEEIK